MNAETNQMLFRMRCIKDYMPNVPITEEGIFRWLLNVKQSSRELQDRGIFPDVDSIIRNKDIPTVRLWVAYTVC